MSVKQKRRKNIEKTSKNFEKRRKNIENERKKSNKKVIFKVYQYGKLVLSYSKNYMIESAEESQE